MRKTFKVFAVMFVCLIIISAVFRQVKEDLNATWKQQQIAIDMTYIWHAAVSAEAYLWLVGVDEDSRMA